MTKAQAPTVICDDGRRRCFWCANDPIYMQYHDTEWGRPERDELKIFEKLCLEGFQAGLSWITVLRKREAFRRGFKGFDPHVVSRFGKRDIDRLMNDAGIVRNRQKIEATISNARIMVDLLNTGNSLSDIFWSHAPSKPSKVPRKVGDHLATTPESIALSKDLISRGFRFVGPTTMYAAMQSLGLVNDHFLSCDFRTSDT